MPWFVCEKCGLVRETAKHEPGLVLQCPKCKHTGTIESERPAEPESPTIVNRRRATRALKNSLVIQGIASFGTVMAEVLGDGIPPLFYLVAFLITFGLQFVFVVNLRRTSLSERNHLVHGVLKYTMVVGTAAVILHVFTASQGFSRYGAAGSLSRLLPTALLFVGYVSILIHFGAVARALELHEPKGGKSISIASVFAYCCYSALGIAPWFLVLSFPSLKPSIAIIWSLWGLGHVFWMSWFAWQFTDDSGVVQQ